MKHTPQIDKNDPRPGWLRDLEAGKDLTKLQRIQRKFALMTVPMVMSVSRPFLSGIGMAQIANHDPTGIATLGLAAASDAEGQIARKTGTDDPVRGAIADAVSDFISAGVVAGVTIATGIIDPLTVAGVYGPKVINAINLEKAKRDNVDMMYTDKLDKTVEVGRWGTLLPFIATQFATEHSEILQATGHGMAICIAALGLKSSYDQIRRRQIRTK